MMERQRKIAEIFAAASELEPTAQNEFVKEKCAADVSLRLEIEELLGSLGEARENSFMSAPALEIEAEHLAEDVESDSRINEIFGHYKIIEKIGAGGMGAIYLAARTDDFEKRVAVKIIKRGMDSDAILRRFRNERQILANLEHPNIAHLIDGGTTGDGLPFFVMEYVEGVTVDEYCRTKNLNETERLALFRKICAAVSFAHQKLIVHRDLKPSNILVTTGGEPKLLDFGIAKLLDSTDDATKTEARVLTPAYASPEQTRGEIVGTSSDVYSLGVILRELLTEQSPMRTAEIERWKTGGDEIKSEGRTDPNASFSTLDSPLLTGDLRIIVLQAMRSEPARRYGSVEAFSEDIRRYLAGLPIAARKDSAAYRASKFVQRNRLAVAVAVLFVLSLIGGIAATLWQARIARHERAVAERRFESLQKSSRSMVSEIHQAMLNLPGSLEARKLLLQRAVEQLDTLAADAGENRQLQLDLADAYQNIGYLGDKPIPERTELFNKAIGFYQKILAQDAKDIEARKGLAMSKVNLADFARLRSETDEALSYNREAVTLLESVVADEPDNLKHKTALWNVSYNAALTLTQTGRAAEALEICRRILPVAVELREKDSDDPSTHRFRRPYLSRALATTNLIHLGKYDEAITEIRVALDENEKNRAAFPDGMIERLDEGVFNHHLAIALERSGRREQAIEAMEKSPAAIEQLVKDDPKDLRYQTSAAQFNSLFGHLLARAGKPEEAVKYFNRAVELDERVIAADAAQKQAKADLAYAYGGRGNALARTGKTAEGLADERKALTLYEELAAADSSNATLLRNYAETLAATGENYLLAGAEKSPDKARDFLKRSLVVWLRMREREILSRFDAEQPERLQIRLEQLSGGA